MECMQWEVREGNAIVGNNTGKIGYFDVCLPFFGLLGISEAICCVPPIVEHVNKQTSQNWIHAQCIDQIGKESKMLLIVAMILLWC